MFTITTITMARAMVSGELAYVNFFKEHLNKLNKENIFTDKQRDISFYMHIERVFIDGHVFHLPIACDSSKVISASDCMKDEIVSLVDSKYFKKKDQKNIKDNKNKEALIDILIPRANAFVSRFSWASRLGFPYKALYNNGDKLGTYCYGEVMDSLNDGVQVIACRAAQNQRCPLADECFKKRAIKGVFP